MCDRPAATLRLKERRVRIPERVGLVAGEGELPAILAREIQARGLDTVADHIEESDLTRGPVHLRCHVIAPGAADIE